MSKCSFSIPFSGDAEKVFRKAKSSVEAQGGQFQGDASGGRFSLQVFGTITGTYSVNGQQLDVVIEDKPMMIPCSAIEKVLSNQLAD